MHPFVNLRFANDFFEIFPDLFDRKSVTLILPSLMIDKALDANIEDGIFSAISFNICALTC